MTLTLDYLRPCTLLDPLRPDLNQDARIDYLPRPTPSWGVRSLYGSDLGAQSDQPRSHPIGPGLPSASLWMAIYPLFSLVGSFLTPVWPQDWEESTRLPPPLLHGYLHVAVPTKGGKNKN